MIDVFSGGGGSGCDEWRGWPSLDSMMQFGGCGGWQCSHLDRWLMMVLLLLPFLPGGNVAAIVVTVAVPVAGVAVSIVWSAVIVLVVAILILGAAAVGVLSHSIDVIEENWGRTRNGLRGVDGR